MAIKLEDAVAQSYKKRFAICVQNMSPLLKRKNRIR